MRDVSALHRSHATERGFTLIEAVIVLALTGIVAAMVGVFIARPIDAYVDLARRAELSDSADLALRRLAREIGTALPNSTRVGGVASNYLEFIPVVNSGRYRAAPAADGSGDFFNVDDSADNSFDVLSAPVVLSAPLDLVIYNLGIPGVDAYAGDNRRPVQGLGTYSTLTYDLVGGQFPYPSPGNRFQLVSTPVTYACLAGAGGTGSLQRYSGYATQSAQPVDVAGAPLAGLTGAANAPLAIHVDACSFSYTMGASARIGLVTIRLTLSSGGEKLTFVQQVHVDNSP